MVIIIVKMIIIFDIVVIDKIIVNLLLFVNVFWCGIFFVWICVIIDIVCGIIIFFEGDVWCIEVEDDIIEVVFKSIGERKKF